MIMYVWFLIGVFVLVGAVLSLIKLFSVNKNIDNKKKNESDFDFADSAKSDKFEFLTNENTEIENDEAILSAAIAIIFTDGFIDQRERSCLNNIAKAKNITKTRLDTIIKNVTTNTYSIPKPESKEEAIKFLNAIIKLLLSIGTIKKMERGLLKKIVVNMGYDEINVNKAIKE